MLEQNESQSFKITFRCCVICYRIGGKCVPLKFCVFCFSPVLNSPDGAAISINGCDYRYSQRVSSVNCCFFSPVIHLSFYHSICILPLLFSDLDLEFKMCCCVVGGARWNLSLVL